MSLEPLTIQLSGETQKKLGAIAILTNRTYRQILEDASQIVDQLISEELVRGATDGRQTTFQSTQGRVLSPPAPAEDQATVGYVSNQQAASAETETEEEGLFGQFSHGLSDDDDDGQDKSPVVTENATLQEAPVKASPQPRKQAKSKQTLDDALSIDDGQLVDVGDDAEAFLDATLGEPAVEQESPKKATAGFAGVGMYSNRPVAASKRFNEKRPRVKISEHTGDED